MGKINTLSRDVHLMAIEKGFYEREKNTGEMLALIHSEVSEALEADRKDSYCTVGVVDELAVRLTNELFVEIYKARVKGTFEEEMADIVIRVMDLCAFKKIDLEAHIEAKMRYNGTREKYHGKKY